MKAKQSENRSEKYNMLLLYLPSLAFLIASCVFAIIYFSGNGGTQTFIIFFVCLFVFFVFLYLASVLNGLKKKHYMFVAVTLVCAILSIILLTFLCNYMLLRLDFIETYQKMSNEREKYLMLVQINEMGNLLWGLCLALALLLLIHTAWIGFLLTANSWERYERACNRDFRLRGIENLTDEELSDFAVFELYRCCKKNEGIEGFFTQFVGRDPERCWLAVSRLCEENVYGEKVKEFLLAALNVYDFELEDETSREDFEKMAAESSKRLKTKFDPIYKDNFPEILAAAKTVSRKY